jgi:dihydroflavonol-4-reductase
MHKGAAFHRIEISRLGRAHGRPTMPIIVNLVDVRDAALGSAVAMEKGRMGHSYINGGENPAVRSVLALMGTPAAVASFSFRPPATRRTSRFHDRIRGRLLDAPDAVGDRRGASGSHGAQRRSDKARHELGCAPRPTAGAERDFARMIAGLASKVLKHA